MNVVTFSSENGMCVDMLAASTINHGSCELPSMFRIVWPHDART